MNAQLCELMLQQKLRKVNHMTIQLVKAENIVGVYLTILNEL